MREGELKLRIHLIMHSVLSEKEWEIVSRRFGLQGNGKQQSLKNLAKNSIHTPREIKLLLRNALLKLKNSPYADELYSYFEDLQFSEDLVAYYGPDASATFRPLTGNIPETSQWSTSEWFVPRGIDL